jgi:hypothetical protein
MKVCGEEIIKRIKIKNKINKISIESQILEILFYTENLLKN